MSLLSSSLSSVDDLSWSLSEGAAQHLAALRIKALIPLLFATGVHRSGILDP